MSPEKAAPRPADHGTKQVETALSPDQTEKVHQLFRVRRTSSVEVPTAAASFIKVR